MKKLLLMIVLIATSILTLTSCGGSDELTIFLYQDNFIYRSDMEVFKKANEYAGIELTGVLQKYDSNYDTIYNLRGKDANLVVNDQDTIEATALKDEIFLDLTPLISEHAPNLKKFFEENPEKKAWATASDGKIYGIPFYTDGKTAKAFFVRQDWVNKLAENNKLPEGIDKNNLDAMSVDDFHKLLKAFKANKSLLTTFSNIYPYFDRDLDFAISELASLWGATAEYYLDEKGVVQYGAIQPEFKTAIENIAGWFKEGLIDPNILTPATEDKRVTYFAQNSGGATHDWIGTTYSFNDDVYAENLVEGFEVVCIAPPTRSDGSKYEPTIRKQIGTVTAINSATSLENQIKLMKWIDYFFSPTGHEQLNFGIEGEHFTKTGSSYSYTDKILNDKATALANLYNIGAQLQSPGVQTFAYEEAWLSEPAKKAMNLYESNNYLNLNYNKLIYPNIKLTNADYQSVNAYRSGVNTVYLEQVSQWLNKGSTTISQSEWDSYVAAMKKAGTDAITTTIQKYVK
ncbi:MAG: hypothetical protein NC310_00875 [Roseburia sp.]|nr:hypothetical protein [Anaeroplasma bactoclasticum]MCM1195606.1 hypothetical protein [Roseburia sp.]